MTSSPHVGRRDFRSCAAGVVLAALLAAGCQQEPVDTAAEPQLPDWVRTDASEGSAGAHLALRLRTGDRFPLRKVIEREVVQSTPQGGPQVHRLRIELTLAMTVEDVREGETTFRVRYDRVRYAHHMGNEVIEFDSAAPPPRVPLSLRAWQAMVGDGFVFRIGRDHQIAAVEGFQEFLQRCLATIPPEHQSEVVLSIESTSGENGVTDFVDNAIGLLPSGERQSPGDSWRRMRHIGRPVPMVIDNVYTLKELDDRLAVVQIAGKITPSTTLMQTPRPDLARVRMTVREGSTWGMCSLFRDTGLPQRSRVEHELLLTVHTSGGGVFDQRVRGVTTIEAFPMPAEGGRTITLEDVPTSPATR